MTNHGGIPASDDAWDSGQLGRDEEFVEVAPTGNEATIDEAMGLQMISIRLQKSLIEDFKFIASLNGISYQPLIRQVLTRFADSEKKRLLREHAEQIREQRRADSADDDDHPMPIKRRA